MQFTFSPHIAFQVKDYDNAVRFYEQVMGMQILKRRENETEVKCGPITFYVEDSPGDTTFFDFSVTDIDRAKEVLAEAGCEVTHEYSATSCMIRDPYGMRFHLFQEE